MPGIGTCALKNLSNYQPHLTHITYSSYVHIVDNLIPGYEYFSSAATAKNQEIYNGKVRSRDLRIHFVRDTVEQDLK